MNDDRTFTTPPLEAEVWGTPQLVLTIVWHHDSGRVGQRALVPATTGVELGRFAPAFSTPGEVGPRRCGIRACRETRLLYSRQRMADCA